MSFWYRDADIPSNFTAAGGMAGLDAIWTTAAKEMQFTNNSTAAEDALVQAYDRRIAAIAEATGQHLENPLIAADREELGRRERASDLWGARVPDRGLFQGPAMPSRRQLAMAKFSQSLIDLEAQHPEFKDAIRASVPIEKDAAELAKASSEEAARMFDSRPGAARWMAMLGGGVQGSLRDPLAIASLALGAGPTASRTVIGRIASAALKEALINGAVEASMQPMVQAWREKAGLPNGLSEAAKNVLFAAGFGGVFGGGAEAIAAGGRRLLTGEWLDRAADHAVKTAPLTPEVKEGLAGKLDRAIEAIRPIREAVPPEARAAIDLHETLSVASRDLPDVAAPVTHERNLDLASRVAADPVTYAPDFEIDRAKIERIVRELVPDAPAPKKSDTRSLQEFLIRAGGVQDQKGEISALGLQNASQKFQGRLVREDGRTLDYARELAAEAGYFNHRYGTAEDAVAKSTVADLLDELDAGSRQRAVQDDDGGRSYVEGRVEELLRQVGPEVDEKLIARAVERAEREKIDLLEAFDQEAAFVNAAELDILDGRGGDVLAARRADPLSRDQAASEPDAIGDEELFDVPDLEDLDPEMMIPFFDDEPPVRAGELIADIQATNAMQRATEVCRIL